MTSILYSFRRCPFAMRGRMALAVSGLDYEHREVVLRDKPPSMLKASPKGTVPVFITSGGDLIEESLDLMYYALGQNDPENWLAGFDATGRALLGDIDGPFKHHLDRYKYKSRYDETAKRGETDINHRQQAENYIQKLEQILEANPFLSGKTRGFADIAIFPFIRQFANTDRTWWDGENQDASPYPNTHAWLEGHIKSELFQSIMTKYPQWVDEVGKG